MRKTKKINKQKKLIKQKKLKEKNPPPNYAEQQETLDEEFIKKKKNQKIKSMIVKLKDHLIFKFKPSKSYLIEMHHTNGTISHVVIKTKIHKFYIGENAYIIDETSKIYCNSTKLYMLRYHEGFSVPFSIEVSSDSLKKALQSDPDYHPTNKEISTSFNPYVLKDVLKFEYAKGVIQGAEVHDFIKKSLIISAITLGAVLIHLILAAYKSGWV